MLTLFAGIGFAALLAGLIFTWLTVRFGDAFCGTWAAAAAGFGVAALAYEFRIHAPGLPAVILCHIGLLVGAGLLWAGVRQLRQRRSRAWLIVLPVLLHGLVIYLASTGELSLEARRASWNLFGASLFLGLVCDAWHTRRAARGGLPSLDLLIASAAGLALLCCYRVLDMAVLGGSAEVQQGLAILFVTLLTVPLIAALGVALDHRARALAAATLAQRLEHASRLSHVAPLVERASGRRLP